MKNKYGLLTILNQVVMTDKNEIALCVCDCGKNKTVMLENLLNSSVQSCGCLQTKKFSEKTIEEFDKKFSGELRLHARNCNEIDRFCTEDVKDFILEALTKERESMIEEFKGIIGDNIPDNPNENWGNIIEGILRDVKYTNWHNE